MKVYSIQFTEIDRDDADCVIVQEKDVLASNSADAMVQCHAWADEHSESWKLEDGEEGVTEYKFGEITSLSLICEIDLLR